MPSWHSNSHGQLICVCRPKVGAHGRAHRRFLMPKNTISTDKTVPNYVILQRFSRLERVTRIELALSAWEADVLPLNYTRDESPGRPQG